MYSDLPGLQICTITEGDLTTRTQHRQQAYASSNLMPSFVVASGRQGQRPAVLDAAATTTPTVGSGGAGNGNDVRLGTSSTVMSSSPPPLRPPRRFYAVEDGGGGGGGGGTSPLIERLPAGPCRRVMGSKSGAFFLNFPSCLGRSRALFCSLRLGSFSRASFTKARRFFLRR